MLVVLVGTSAAAEPCPPPGEKHRCIELTADGSGELPEVQISPGEPTTFISDSDMREDGMTLEHGERFEVAEAGTRTITLVPSVNVLGATPGKMTICFADGASPTCATFSLVAHPAIADRQVRIFRRARNVDSYRAELKRTREEIEKLRAENERLRMENERPAGLIGLLDSGLMDEKGIPAQPIEDNITQRKGNALRAQRVTAFRARGRVLLELWLANPAGAEPWKAAGAILLGPKGEALKASVWQVEPIPSSEFLRVLIEVMAPDERTQGSFTLKLWDAEGQRVITIGNITFPK
ncbi:MAG TPA: DUF2381 family protein [Myxococcaceae bacterium]|nr:DUF2381 family protein [Myxococcaceae bacterium]